jgi:hypothetical protein
LSDYVCVFTVSLNHTGSKEGECETQLTRLKERCHDIFCFCFISSNSFIIIRNRHCRLIAVVADTGHQLVFNTSHQFVADTSHQFVANTSHQFVADILATNLSLILAIYLSPILANNYSAVSTDTAEEPKGRESL